jgi:hypothetical protein
MARTAHAELVVLEFVTAASERRTAAEREFRRALVGARRAGLQLSLIAQAAGISASRAHGIIEEEEAMHSPAESVRLIHGTSDDVLVVAAGRAAARDYYELNAYVCQPGRSFRDVDRIGFYRHRRLEPHFPRIRHRVDHVEFSRSNAGGLRSTGAALDHELADLIDVMLDQGRRREGDPYQVFLLTAPDSPDTLVLDTPIQHTHVGRGSAWTQGTRYTSEDSLRANPRTTDDLD